jgi:hypothetical protein
VLLAHKEVVYEVLATIQNRRLNTEVQDKVWFIEKKLKVKIKTNLLLAKIIWLRVK